MPYNGKINENESSEDPLENASFQKHAISQQSHYGTVAKRLDQGIRANITGAY